jgi:pilus assembly protein Flp/PilA
MKSLVRRFLKDQNGATAIEYGLVAVIVSIAIVVALTLMAAPLEALYVNIRDGVASAGK